MKIVITASSGHKRLHGQDIISKWFKHHCQHSPNFSLKATRWHLKYRDISTSCRVLHNFSKAVFSHLTADHIISLSSSLCRRHAFVALVPILLVLVLLVLLVFVLFV